MSRVPRLLALAAVWVALGSVLVHLARHPEVHGWDLRVYYDSARAFEAGLSPYDETARGGLPAVADDEEKPYPAIADSLAFVYPPIAIHAFRPLARLDYLAAYRLWLLAKVLALLALAWLWARRFQAMEHSPLALLVLLLGFNAALVADLSSGNVSLFEQLALWAAFALFLSGRDAAFALAVAAIAQFRLAPAAFLGFLLVLRHPPRWRAFGLGLLATAALFALNGLEPQLLAEFRGSGLRLYGRGRINPSSLALAQEASAQLAALGLRAGPWLAQALYGLVAAAVAGLTLSVLWRRRRDLDRCLLPALLLGVCAYALAVPRLKGYSYVILLPPTLYVARRLRERALVPVVAALALLPSRSSPLGFTEALRLAGAYAPWITAVVVFALLARELWTGVPGAGGDAGPGEVEA